MELVDNNCVLYPRVLEFRVIPRPNSTVLETNVNYTLEEPAKDSSNQSSVVDTATIAQDTVYGKTTERNVVKREIPDNRTMDTFDTMEETNVTVITGKFQALVRQTLSVHFL